MPIGTPSGALGVGLEKPPEREGDGRKSSPIRQDPIALELLLTDTRNETLLMQIQDGIEVVVRHERHDRLAQHFTSPPLAFVLGRPRAVYHSCVCLQTVFNPWMKPGCSPASILIMRKHLILSLLRGLSSLF